jgi:hypothetical protein
VAAPADPARSLWLRPAGCAILVTRPVIFLAPALADAAARAAAAGAAVCRAVGVRSGGLSGHVVEIIFVVRSQEPHSGQDDDHDQDDHSCQNDQQGIVVHRTIQPGMALVRRSAGARGHQREPPW